MREMAKGEGRRAKGGRAENRRRQTGLLLAFRLTPYAFRPAFDLPC
jgi:hypothetical protein